VSEEPTSRGALLDLALSNKKGLVGNVKLKDSLDCSDHKVVEFQVPRAVSSAHSKLAPLYSRRADFGLFRNLLSRVPWALAGEKRGPGKLVQIQGSPPPSSGVMHANKEQARQKHREACVDEQDAPQDTKRKPAEGGSRDQ